MAITLFILFLAVLAYGLQRNYRPARSHSALAGSSDVVDRDSVRIQSELRLRA
jgi:hypothetical protein